MPVFTYLQPLYCGSCSDGTRIALLRREAAYRSTLCSQRRFPWHSGADMKWRFTQLPDAALTLVFARDRDGGRVTADAAGRPVLHYWPSAHDRESMVRGIELALRAALAAGAVEMFSIHLVSQMDGSQMYGKVRFCPLLCLLPVFATQLQLLCISRTEESKCTMNRSHRCAR